MISPLIECTDYMGDNVQRILIYLELCVSPAQSVQCVRHVSRCVKFLFLKIVKTLFVKFRISVKIGDLKTTSTVIIYHYLQPSGDIIH